MRTVSIALLLAGLLGCGDDGARGEARPSAADEAEEAARQRAERQLFGPDGELLESDQRVAGLALPRGLETVLDEERSHVYHSRAPLRKLQSYFGQRLLTGQVDRMGDGAVYRNAAPRGVRGGVVHMDVSILPMDRDRTRVEIIEIPPAPENPPTEAEYLEALERDQHRWE